MAKQDNNHIVQKAYLRKFSNVLNTQKIARAQINNVQYEGKAKPQLLDCRSSSI